MKKQSSLKEALGLEKHDTIVAVGAGGKTTFCLALCDELKNENKVFFTTTTKIFLPEIKENYKIYIGENILENDFFESGAYIIGKERRGDDKILPFDLETIDKLKEKCDYLIIEGDGSRMKPLKGWNETEPVFVKRTDKTIGVVSIKSVGLTINENNVHRADRFLKITKSALEEKVTVDHLCNMICEKNGLFKDCMGEKVLLINQTESETDHENALKLTELLKERKINLDKIIISSLKNKTYYLI